MNNHYCVVCTVYHIIDCPECLDVYYSNYGTHDFQIRYLIEIYYYI